MPQFVGIFGRPGLGLGNGLVRVLNGALGAGAALFQRGRQRSLHQELVSQNQHDEQQNRGHGPDQERLDLLNDFWHGGTGSLRRSNPVFSRVEPLFVSGADPQVNEVGS